MSSPSRQLVEDGLRRLLLDLCQKFHHSNKDLLLPESKKLLDIALWLAGNRFLEPGKTLSITWRSNVTAEKLFLLNMPWSMCSTCQVCKENYCENCLCSWLCLLILCCRVTMYLAWGSCRDLCKSKWISGCFCLDRQRKVYSQAATYFSAGKVDFASQLQQGSPTHIWGKTGFSLSVFVFDLCFIYKGESMLAAWRWQCSPSST